MKYKAIIWIFVFCIAISSVSAHYCYQPQANASTSCGGLATGSYYADDANENFYVNWTIPSSAIGAKIDIKHANMSAYNISLAQADFDGGVLSFGVDIFADAGIFSSQPIFLNHSTWQNVGLYNSSSFDGQFSYHVATGTNATLWHDNNYATYNAYESWNELANRISISSGSGSVLGVILNDVSIYWDINYIDTYNATTAIPEFGQSFYLYANNSLNTTFMNFSVTHPNGSSIVYAGNYTNGYWITSNITALNGTYTINVSNNATNTRQWNFTVEDDLIIDPSTYVHTVSAGQNYTFNITITTNTQSPLNFTLACNPPSNFTSCGLTWYRPIINTSQAEVVISTNSSNPDYIYTGNITVTRDLDNRIDTINLTLGVSTLYGVPEIQNMTNIGLSIYSDDSTSANFAVKNIGTYNLTNCQGSLDTSFLGWTFYSTSKINISINETKNFTLTFTNPSIGSYSGYLQITCNATILGTQNSLALDNRPIITLTSTARPVNTGGGGGSSTTIILDNSSFQMIPNILDTMHWIIESPVWNYTVVTNKVLSRCEINNKFTCTVKDNKVILTRVFDENIITDYITARLTIYSGSEALTRDVRVRVINAAYYIPVSGMLQIPYFSSGDGIYPIPFIFVLIIIAVIYLGGRK